MAGIFTHLRWATLENPVLLKELRIGLRQRRLFVTQIGFLIILLLITVLMITAMLSNVHPEELPENGKRYFETVFWVQLVLLGMITPGLTCGSLSGEREKHSLDMVLASRLSAAEIVAGKLGYAVYSVVLLLFSSLPIAAVAFFLGGVSPGEAIRAYGELFTYGVLAALVGLFYSSREKRSSYATSQTYMMVFLLGLTLLPLYALVRSYDPSQLPKEIAVLSPMQMLAVAVGYAIFFLFVKSAHRLKPQFVYIQAMAFSFLLVYLLFLGLALVAYSITLAGSSLQESEWAALMVPVGIGHLVWVGMFCNVEELSSTHENRRYQRSLFSKNLFWMLFLAAGMGAPAIYCLILGLPQTNVATASLLGALYVMVFPILARAIGSFFKDSRFAVVFFVTLALSMGLPTLGLLLEHPGLGSAIYLSPLLSLASLTADSHLDGVGLGGAKLPLATCSAAAYLVLGLLAGLRLMLRARAKK